MPTSSCGPTCNHWLGMTSTAPKKLSLPAPLLRGAPFRALRNCLGKGKTPPRVSRPGLRLKTKVLYGLRGGSDEPHQHLVRASCCPAPSLALIWGGCWSFLLPFRFGGLYSLCARRLRF